MMSPIGLYLPDFSAHKSFDPFDLPGLEGLGEADAGAEHDMLLEREKARREGFEEGAASAREALASEAAALGSHYAEQLDAERRRWAQSEGAALAELLKGEIARLEDSIATALADVLQPFMHRETRLKVVAELREAIASLLTNDPCAAIRITGPADLLQGLGPMSGVETVAAETPEVTLLAGDTVIRSKLRSWAAAMAAAGALAPSGALGSGGEAQP